MPRRFDAVLGAFQVAGLMRLDARRERAAGAGGRREPLQRHGGVATGDRWLQ